MTQSEKVDIINQFEAAEGYPRGSILNVMIFETAGTLRTDIRNKYSGAVGLIQFLKSTCTSLGYSVDQVSAMSFTEQIALVKRYLLPYRSKLLLTKDQLDFYLAVLYPALMGKPDSGIMAKKDSIIYSQNNGLDLNHDGVITKADIRHYFYRTVDKFRIQNAMEPVTVTASIDTFGVLLLIIASIACYYV